MKTNRALETLRSWMRWCFGLGAVGGFMVLTFVASLIIETAPQQELVVATLFAGGITSLLLSLGLTAMFYWLVSKAIVTAIESAPTRQAIDEAHSEAVAPPAG